MATKEFPAVYPTLFCLLFVCVQPSDRYESMDQIARNTYDKMDQFALRSELLKIGSEVGKNLYDPELRVRKAFVAECLTKDDAKHGTNNWDRAAAHFEEAIELWQAIEKSKDVRQPRAARRITTLLIYRANALAKQKKYDEALTVLKDATHEDFKDKAAELRKEYEAAKNKK